MILYYLRNQSKTDDIGEAPEVSNALKIMQNIELLHINIDIHNIDKIKDL